MKSLPPTILPGALSVLLAFCTVAPAPAAPSATDQITVVSRAGSRLLSPGVALTAEGGALVVWEDSTEGIRALRLGPGDGVARPARLAASDVPDVLPYQGPIVLQRDPVVVPLENGEFLAFWTQERQEVFIDILYQDTEVVASTIQVRRFDGAGRPAGPQFELSSGELGLESAAHAVRLEGGRVAVVWSVNDGQAPQGVYGRLVGPRGLPHGTAFRIDEPGAEEAGRRPVLAALPDGGFVVAWQACCDAGGDPDVVARRFDELGDAVGAPFAIPEDTAGPQAWPTLAAGADGEVMAAWMGAGGVDDAVEYRVYGQRLSADGTRSGPRQSLSSGGGRAHGAPALAALSDGYALVWTVWHRHFVTGVFGVALDADGAPRGDAVKLSQGSVQFQWELALTTDPAGRVVSAWQGFDRQGRPAINAWTLAPSP